MRDLCETYFDDGHAKLTKKNGGKIRTLKGRISGAAEWRNILQDGLTKHSKRRNSKIF